MLHRAYWFGATGATLEIYQGSIFRKKPVVTIKPESEEMTEDSEVISKEEESQPVQVEEFKEQEELPLNEKDIITTEIIVKCPQCKHIFATKKEGETTKIKCPKCGKEGIAQ